MSIISSTFEKISVNTKQTNINFYLLIAALGIFFILLEVWISSGTMLSPDNYGRYLEPLWANDILISGHLRENPFPNEVSLYSNANSYIFNFIPAITIVVINLATGIGINKIQMTPIYGVLFFFSIILVSNALYNRKLTAIIFAILLFCFLTYSNNLIARDMNRIILSYSVFYFFLYSFISSKNRSDIRFRLMQIFFIIFFIFTYSSNSISVILLILILAMFEVFTTKKIEKINIGILYLTICLLYYLILTDFLTSGIVGFKRIFEAKGFTFQYSLFTKPGMWPTEMQYFPIYSWLDWFFLIYPFIINGILLLLAFLARLKEIFRKRIITLYDELLFSILIFILSIIIFNALAVFPTAGLDYIALFSWFSPLLSVYSLDKVYSLGGGLFFNSIIPRKSHKSFKNRKSMTKLKIISIILIISLGLAGILNYNTLDQRDAEKVSQKEVAASCWLGKMDLIVTSDLHFISTYVTINGVNAHHFLPMDKDFINQLYYNVNTSNLKSKEIDAFVVTKAMKSSYITHFLGSRTIPNPNLDVELSTDTYKIYDNCEITVFYL